MEIILKSATNRAIQLIHPANIKIIGAYAPTEQATEEQKKAFWEELREAVGGEDPIILIGDLNAGHEEIKHATARGDGQVKPNFSSRFVDFSTDLQDPTPWTNLDLPSLGISRFQHPGKNLGPMFNKNTKRFCSKNGNRKVRSAPIRSCCINSLHIFPRCSQG